MKSIVTIEELAQWSHQFITELQKKDSAIVITLSGDLGAGKTTLTQSIGKSLGITDPITSPTFVIQKEYEILNHEWIKKMIHIDAYRLERKEDLEYLGWNELIREPGTLIIIEWPEMVQGIEIPYSINLELSINNDHSRTIIKTTS